MKSLIKISLFALIALMVLPLDCDAKSKKKLRRQRANEYDVYLLIGQSNMAGRGMLLPEDSINTIEGVWLLNANDEPEPARNPLNKYSSIRKSNYKVQRMSPGYGFSTKLYKETGRKILLVHNARGATVISWWLPGSDYATPNYFSEAVRRTKEAMKYGTLRGILWHQGCGDSKGNLPKYMGRLQELVKSLRSELNAPDVPFIAGELAHWRTSSPRFNEMIHTISDNIPNSSWVSSEGCDMLKDEKDAHFGRNGQILLGERYADKVLEMVYKK